MRLYILAARPVLDPSTRYRILQYLPILERHGIKGRFSSFLSAKAYQGLYSRDKILFTVGGVLDGIGRSGRALPGLRDADVVWIEREAAPIGPPLFEWMVRKGLRRPIIYDLDDAVYLKQLSSPVYGKWIQLLKSSGKVNQLIGWADHIVCGNETVRQYVKSLRPHVSTSIVPTAVDTTTFTARDNRVQDDSTPTVGWIGSHSTTVFLEPLFPVLQSLARKHDFTLKIVGAGRAFELPGLRLQNVAWNLEREVADFQSLDIGLYPLGDSASAAGKSGLKAIQYMAVGVPFVVSPVGITKEIVVHGETGYLANSADEWFHYLDRLLSGPDLRHRMGNKGREMAVRCFDAQKWGDEVVNIIRSVVQK